MLGVLALLAARLGGHVDMRCCGGRCGVWTCVGVGLWGSCANAPGCKQEEVDRSCGSRRGRERVRCGCEAACGGNMLHRL